jgi:ABC-type multidrug transport system ATPase subunit
MDNDNSKGRSGGRAKRNPSKASDFSTKRFSFLSPELIRARESQKSFEERLSLRRQSRAYSVLVDKSDILHPQVRIRLEWKNVGYSIVKKTFFGKIKKEAKIICGVSGSVAPGNIVAILGPSGSGKTTLLNILGGKTEEEGKVEGKIFMNGVERRKSHLKVIGFVEQNTPYLDYFLTVREILEMTANLTLPSKYTAQEKMNRIEKVMRKTGIERIADCVVGKEGVSGISSGERKRLAIAKELLCDSKVLLLDEPTSNLDASTSAELVKFLRELAIIDNLTIIVTVHQPRVSVLSKFDFFILLAKGKTVFNGNVDEALEHFKELGFDCPNGHNPANFLLDTVSLTNEDGDDIAEELHEVWKPFEEAIAEDIELNELEVSEKKLTKFERPIGRHREIRIIIQWKFRSILRDPKAKFSLIAKYLIYFFLFFPVFFQLPISGFGSVQNRIGFLRIVTFDSAALMSFCVYLVSERKRIIDERRSSRYRLSSFYFASAMTEIIIWSVIPMPLLTALYYIAHFRYTPFTSFLIFLSVQILYLIVAVFLGGVFGSLVKEKGTSIRIIFMVWSVLKIFQGTNLNTNNVSPVIFWIRYISAPYYLQAGLSQNEFVGQIIDGKPGEYWIITFAFNGASEMWCAGALMIMMAGFYVMGFLILYFKTTPKFKI